MSSPGERCTWIYEEEGGAKRTPCTHPEGHEGLHSGESPAPSENPIASSPQGERSESDAKVDPVDAAQASDGTMRGSERKFGGLSPKEAADLRWEKQRARALEADEAIIAGASDALLVLVPVAKGLVIKRLDEDARKGSTQAARELRAWLSEYPPTDESFDPASIERVQRVRLYARLLMEDEALEQSSHSEVPA